jgi:hypothetical protein
MTAVSRRSETNEEGVMQAKRRWIVALSVWIGLMMAVVPQAAEEPAPEYKNLKVLPKDISRADLDQIMLDNLSGLGLRRRSGEGCLFCHAGSMDVPRAEWDYASDEKPMKQKSRVMMAMVQEINQGHLAKLSSRSAPEVEVTCYTCHAARTNPMPLQARLLAEYEGNGVDGVKELYRSLRSRYHEADAYDFRVSTLIGVADQLFANDAIEAAAEIHRLNIEFHDGDRAHGGLILLRMLQAFDTDGVDAMVKRYQALKSEHPATAFTPLLIGGLGWHLFRTDRKVAGFRLFELSFAEYPESYWSIENLAWGSQGSGDHDRAIELAEDWLATNPDHEMGQRLLSELRGAENR